jgi:hypothetical protein
MTTKRGNTKPIESTACSTENYAPTFIQKRWLEIEMEELEAKRVTALSQYQKTGIASHYERSVKYRVRLMEAKRIYRKLYDYEEEPLNS